MVIVSGHLIVAAEERSAYLDTCRAVVEQARQARGCLDYALSADIVDPSRINILERWTGRPDLEAFRGDGTADEQAAMIRSASVAEYEVGEIRTLT